MFAACLFAACLFAACLFAACLFAACNIQDKQQIQGQEKPCANQLNQINLKYTSVQEIKIISRRIKVNLFWGFVHVYDTCCMDVDHVSFFVERIEEDDGGEEDERNEAEGERL
ncbi:hypothetical protein DFA_11922 [Cavenderia fasciculata]|uniref:Secreted protein n=1 Tax=Cavenderia fasciculata TaxID=261658 RepID=F4QEU7_CACFS|nr:uncharacterized protein DFA_11922 [Cavenderia fasciculata]EGG14154.1 hypothetical protein DFA_11922 [Cavenderia fasciculata]|eukprot:XP_004350862.1 hypothetical protein DFA_11922 [Cavenderia fasciculata]